MVSPSKAVFGMRAGEGEAHRPMNIPIVCNLVNPSVPAAAGENDTACPAPARRFARGSDVSPTKESQTAAPARGRAPRAITLPPSTLDNAVLDHLDPESLNNIVLRMRESHSSFGFWGGCALYLL